MLPIISLPARIIKLLEANIAPGEIAAGICLGMFMGFVPLNGPITILLVLLFLFMKINRLSAMLSLPLFKLFYVLGVSYLADWIGRLLLIRADFLDHFWKVITGLPVLAYLELNHTLVIGGLAVSTVLSIPLYLLSVKGIISAREKYAGKIHNLPFIKWIKKVPILSKLMSIVFRVKGGI